MTTLKIGNDVRAAQLYGEYPFLRAFYESIREADALHASLRFLLEAMDRLRQTETQPKP